MASNDDLIFEAEGEVMRPIRGLEYGGENEINCMSCDRSLMTIMQVKSTPKHITMSQSKNQKLNFDDQRFQAKCPFCGSKSWIAKGSGHLMVGAIEEQTTIIDMQMEFKEDHLFTTVEVGKV